MQSTGCSRNNNSKPMSEVDVLPQNPCYVSIAVKDERLTITGKARTLVVGEMVQVSSEKYPIAEPTFWNPTDTKGMLTLQVSGFVPANLTTTQANSFNDCKECESSLVEILFG